MSECDRETGIFRSPRANALTLFPFHRVGLDPVDRPQSHLVQLALLGHAFNRERARVTVLDSFHAEIEPCAKVAHICVRQSIPVHVTVEKLWIIICLDAARQIA